MKFLTLVALILVITPFALADADPCEDYCRAGLLYTGTLNPDTRLCTYAHEPCAQGCSDDDHTCAPPAEQPAPRVVVPQISTGTSRLGPGQEPAAASPRPSEPLTRRITTIPGTATRKPVDLRTGTPPPARQTLTLFPQRPACLTDDDCANDATLDRCAGTWKCVQLAKQGMARCMPEEDTAVSCPTPQNPCMKAYCLPATGECDEVLDTTKKNAAGKPCACWSDADCAKQEDGDFCNGLLYCNKKDSTCTVNPGTVVTCGTYSDTECAKNTCNPKTGKCGMVPFPNKPCASGHPCYTGTCNATGYCSTVWNPLNKNAQGEPCQCDSQKECVPYEDGDLCNGTLYCNLATSRCLLNPATVKKCPSVDDTTCGKNTCNPKTGTCEMLPINEAQTCYSSLCFDGTCAKGKCTTFWNNKCECAKDADCAKFQKDKCSGGYYCDHKNGKCVLNNATIVTCPTGLDTFCLKTSCDPNTGTCAQKPANEGTPCDSGHACIDSVCTGGSCTGAWNFAKTLATGSKCQCKSDPDCAKFEDGDLCNGTLYCNKQNGTCVLNPATVKKCPTVDDTTCSKNTCNPKTGTCSPLAVNEGKPCSDTHPCIDTACTKGACNAQWNYAKVFADGKKCLCKNNADCAKYEDGVSCNGTLYCDMKSNTCAINPKTVTC